jgi:hypothetical protein
MSKHTPGPWKFDKYHETLLGKDGEVVIDFEPYEGMYFVGDKQDANVRLIEAAPEMYELLREVTGGMSAWDKKVMALLAKVEGK